MGSLGSIRLGRARALKRNSLLWQLRFTVPVLLKPGAKYAGETPLAISSQLVTSAGKEQKNLKLTIAEKAEQTVGTVSPEIRSLCRAC